MAALFDGPAEFHDCDDVTLMLDGGSDDAGFVQIIRGKVETPDTLKAMMTDTQQLHEMRPEILGGTLAIEADGTFTETVAFSDEASARKGEQVAMPDDVRQAMESAISDVTTSTCTTPGSPPPARPRRPGQAATLSAGSSCRSPARRSVPARG